MTINQPIAKILNEMADLLELGNDNPFRIRAFRRAAQMIETIPHDLGTLTEAERLSLCRKQAHIAPPISGW